VTGAVIPTTLVGSYPQPDWLIDREALAKTAAASAAGAGAVAH
jgi:methionine synthase II (cobalamin-independent)